MKPNLTTLVSLFFFLSAGVVSNPLFSQSSQLILKRAEYLLKVKEAQEKEIVFEDSGIKISDLLYPNWLEWYQRSANPILIPVGKFYSFTQERKVHILSHPTTYILAPDEEFPLKITISRQEYEAMPFEKRERMEKEFRLTIQD
jgi:hypothetical protein